MLGWRHRVGGAAGAVLVLLLVGPSRTESADATREQRLDALQDEMKRLQREMGSLAQREQGVLGDVRRLDAEIALHRAELEDITLRLGETEERLAASEKEIAEITAGQARRAPQLAARIREIYKRGPAGLLARVISPLDISSGLDGFRYATYLSHRDAEQLAAWRSASRLLAEEREQLSKDRARLTSQQALASLKEGELLNGRAARASLLERIRGDREQHEKAFSELEDAARNLGRLVDSVEEVPSHVALDVRKFRGLLDWPAEGAVSAKFGTVIHPRFKTQVPHPGLDIDAPEGAPFRAIFDGHIAYAAPLNGYGLTVVVDHGHGVVSVYAHAGVLLVESGQEVLRGQDMGRVGDSGSLRGAYLYFEMRDGGRPTDPAAWLRRR
jgi:septal ring factor EnvC (AmiA/AmiB activator)